MILPCIDDSTDFPPVTQAAYEPDGLLCYGGDLSCQRLIKAYRQGIFPWYSDGEPILWWSPSQRMVLYPNKLHVSKSLKKSLNQCQPTFHYNHDFAAVINHCAKVPRAEKGTWIHQEMIDAYTELFSAGHAFCLEAEVGGALVGGIYGVISNEIFCGESMFSTQTNGSKFAMYGLVKHMLENQIKLLDCQIYNPHLESMGAELIPRNRFLRILNDEQ